MSDLLATQSGWLIPLLAGLLLVSLAVIVWLARRGMALYTSQATAPRKRLRTMWIAPSSR